MAIPKQWQSPEGLNRPAPRPVRLSGLGKALVILSLVFVALGGGMGLLAHGQSQRQAEREQSLRDRGIDVTATVTKTWMGGSSKSRTPMVSYRFTAGGREVKGESSMDRDLWQKIYEGDTLSVRYLPERPSVNRPARGAPGPLPGWMAWFSVGFFVWPIFLFLWMIRRQSRLLAEGSPVAGTVTQVVRVQKTMVVYEFRLPMGETMYGRSAVNRDATPEQGERICVLYDPDRPRRNAMYPLPLMRLAEE